MSEFRAIKFSHHHAFKTSQFSYVPKIPKLNSAELWLPGPLFDAIVHLFRPTALFWNVLLSVVARVMTYLPGRFHSCPKLEEGGGEGGAAPSPHPACAGVIIKI